MKFRRLTFLIATAIGVSVVFSGLATAQNPVPLINQPLLPDAAKPGGAAFTVTVNGTGFVSGAVVKWNGSARATTFVSSSRLKAAIMASDIAKASTASVTVVNPTPGGGTSNVVFFEVARPSSSIGFSAPANLSAGALPSSVAVGDFNRDGRPDLAVANSGSNSISVLLGNGDGTFKPHADYSTGDYPQSVAVGDFNGDSKLDLAVENQSGTVSVLLGNGDGTFQSAVEYGSGSGPGPLSVAVGDFNRDGKLDLAVANYPSNSISVLLGNGDGSFQAAVNYGTGIDPYSVAVGDLNGDGKLDLAVANYGGNSISVLLGNGDGTFQPHADYDTGDYPESVAVGDFNGDGKLDLAVGNYGSPSISVLLGNGDGTFQGHVDYGAGTHPSSVAVGDFNGDGKLDLAVPNDNSNSVSLLLGNGDGTFQAHVDYGTGSYPASVAVGDFNRDGRLDMAVADTFSNAVSVLLQIPAILLSKTSLTFADQLVGTSSPSQTVTLTNGGLQLTISSIAVTGTDAGDFNQTNTCGSGLPPGGKCTIAVTFTPTGKGPRTASVTITDNAAGRPQEIGLSGTGVVSGPNATLSLTSLTFVTQLLGATSPAQSVTLTDYGTAALSITSTGFTGANPHDFVQTNTCGSSVAPGASCTISVSLKPTVINTRTASLSIADNAPGSPQKVSLSGTGTEVELPTSLSFSCGYLHGHCPPPAQPVTLTNVGSTSLSITGITTTGPFSQKNTCGSSVPAGKSCTISVTFTASAVGTYSGAVSITDNGGGSPQQVSLSGVVYIHPPPLPLSRTSCR